MKRYGAGIVLGEESEGKNWLRRLKRQEKRLKKWMQKWKDIEEKIKEGKAKVR